MSTPKRKEGEGSPMLLALQASPRRKGFTAQLMEILLQGAGQVDGVAVEEVFLPDQNLDFCRGCFVCKSEPYHCRLADDMGRNGAGTLHRKLEEANALLITLPTYLWGANALTHAFLERCYCFLWSEELNGMPFAYAASALNSGMHRQAARDVEKWAFIVGLEQIGGMPVHHVQLEESREELTGLGRRLAGAAREDFGAGRQARKPEEKYPQALEQSWDLLGLYLDNMTGGTGKKEDLLTTQGFDRGWFRYREAFRFFEESDALFRRVIDLVESDQRDEALRVLARAHRTWKDGTFLEYVSRNT